MALFVVAPTPPVDLIEKSKQAVSSAQKAEVQLYAPHSSQCAYKHWEALLASWAKENNRVFFRRDFSKITDLSRIIDSCSEAALKEADSVKKSLNIVANIQILNAQKILDRYEERYKRFPLASNLRKKALSGEMLLAEARSAYVRKEYKNAFEKCMLAEDLLIKSEAAAYKLLKEYYGRQNEWHTWVSESLKKSKVSGSSAIIIDKMAQSCKIYINGELRGAFTAEFGANWIGDKKRKGDKATPEGRYKITLKKGKGHSRYYKALLINYPNERDKKEFRNNGRDDNISQLGGLIEIHGHGGKGSNWTDGCVALHNSDMDKLFNMVDIGTPVTIVGSLAPPPEYINE